MKEYHAGKRVFAVGVVAVIIVTVYSASVGAAGISPLDALRVALAKMPIWGKYVDLGGVSASHESILLYVRFPRIVLGLLAGCGLAVAGTAMQGMLKNPMADPFIVGTSSGAALGAAVAIVFRFNQSFFGYGAVSGMAFIGALLSTGIVYRLARLKTRVPVTALLLAGIATGQFFTAILSFLMVIASRDVNSIVYWTLGSLSARGWSHVLIISVPVIGGMLILMIFSRDLNLMLLGEDTAANTGVDVESVKRMILGISALMTAFVVSVTGIIGFVGLIVPHMTRMIAGPDHRFLIPASGLYGGVFLVAADALARTLISPAELPVGILTALAGAPFFIYLLRKHQQIH